MAKAPTRPAEQEAEVVDPKGAMARLAELTRRVIAVPKEEMPQIFTKPKKRAKRKRH
jgi:hypothetical protein